MCSDVHEFGHFQAAPVREHQQAAEDVRALVALLLHRVPVARHLGLGVGRSESDVIGVLGPIRLPGRTPRDPFADVGEGRAVVALAVPRGGALALRDVLLHPLRGEHHLGVEREVLLQSPS
ncbi:hypothetical protein CGZ91_11350 [Parenemella sanctibonifatiensis]|uniref:Uncharacterized protein n=1 Tax=Parenemella sanctibonifatiensis TaxID=2016505 RepID=A0A255ED62_9ACTN|nr:hypothetical protein CGZ91_11350 [Parenemella sanctibonifatiensis]